MARNPALCRAWFKLGTHLLRQTALSPRERDLVVCRTAWLGSGEYEWSAHIGIGRGFTANEASRIAQGAETGWSEREATLLRAVTELYNDDSIGDGTWARLGNWLNARESLDFVLTVESYRMLAMALNTFGAQLDPGMRGFPKL
jgi:hypothetical protein